MTVAEDSDDDSEFDDSYEADNLSRHAGAGGKSKTANSQEVTDTMEEIIQSVTEELMDNLNKLSMQVVGKPLMGTVSAESVSRADYRSVPATADLGDLAASAFLTGGLRFIPCALAEARPLALRPPFGFLPSALCHAGDLAIYLADFGPDILDVDTLTRDVALNGSYEGARAKLDVLTEFFFLQPGANEIEFVDDKNSVSTGLLKVFYRSGWLG